MRPTVIDFFCGVGGLSLAFAQSGFKLVGGVDSDSHAITAYKTNFPRVKTSAIDLFEASGDDIAKELYPGKLDLVIGGPPCQGFSFGGLQNKNDDRNEGVLAFARLIAELQPRFFVMENVRGFLSAKHERKRRRFIEILQRDGYQIRLPIRVMDAADYGVPQRRLRAFVLGCREGEILPEYPAATTRKRVTVRDAIGDLQNVDQFNLDRDNDIFEGKLSRPTAYSKLLRQNPIGVTVRLSGCQRTQHSVSVVDRFNKTPPGSQETVSRYYRLAWDGISPTIRAGTGPEHGSHTAPRPIHPVHPRCITVREAARLHSFPDWFTFHGTRWHGFRQIGNSVPPNLANAIAANVLKAIQA